MAFQMKTNTIYSDETKRANKPNDNHRKWKSEGGELNEAQADISFSTK